ncbi:hypothetical protein ACA910_002276 [Epithemia clementina (nom. ined.)]
MRNNNKNSNNNNWHRTSDGHVAPAAAAGDAMRTSSSKKNNNARSEFANGDQKTQQQQLQQQQQQQQQIDSINSTDDLHSIRSSSITTTTTTNLPKIPTTTTTTTNSHALDLAEVSATESSYCQASPLPVPPPQLPSSLSSSAKSCVSTVSSSSVSVASSTTNNSSLAPSDTTGVTTAAATAIAASSHGSRSITEDRPLLIPPQIVQAATTTTMASTSTTTNTTTKNRRSSFSLESSSTTVVAAAAEVSPLCPPPATPLFDSCDAATVEPAVPEDEEEEGEVGEPQKQQQQQQQQSIRAIQHDDDNNNKFTAPPVELVAPKPSKISQPEHQSFGEGPEPGRVPKKKKLRRGTYAEAGNNNLSTTSKEDTTRTRRPAAELAPSFSSAKSSTLSVRNAKAEEEKEEEDRLPPKTVMQGKFRKRLLSEQPTSIAPAASSPFHDTDASNTNQGNRGDGNDDHDDSEGNHGGQPKSAYAHLPEGDRTLVQRGTRVAVYWRGDDLYFEGVVKKERPHKKKCFFVEYDDGDEEWLSFRKVPFFIVAGGGKASPKPPPVDEEEEQENEHQQAQPLEEEEQQQPQHLEQQQPQQTEHVPPETEEQQKRPLQLPLHLVSHVEKQEQLPPHTHSQLPPQTDEQQNPARATQQNQSLPYCHHDWVNDDEWVLGALKRKRNKEKKKSLAEESANADVLDDVKNTTTASSPDTVALTPLLEAPPSTTQQTKVPNSKSATLVIVAEEKVDEQPCVRVDSGMLSVPPSPAQKPTLPNSDTAVATLLAEEKVDERPCINGDTETEQNTSSPVLKPDRINENELEELHKLFVEDKKVERSGLKMEEEDLFAFSPLSFDLGDVHIPISEKVKLGRRRNRPFDAPTSPSPQKARDFSSPAKKKEPSMKRRAEHLISSKTPIRPKKSKLIKEPFPPVAGDGTKKAKISSKQGSDPMRTLLPNKRPADFTIRSDSPPRHKKPKIVNEKVRSKKASSTCIPMVHKKKLVEHESVSKHSSDDNHARPRKPKMEKDRRPIKETSHHDEKDCSKKHAVKIETASSTAVSENNMAADENSSKAMEEARRRKEEARPLSPSEILAILGEDSPCAGSSNWVRRSARMPSRAALMAPNTQVLLHKLCSSDDDMVVLKMKKYVSDPATPSVVIDAVLDALEENTNCESLYIQNYNEGMCDAQVLRLLEILKKPSCKIWCLNIGETYKVKRKTWKKFARGLRHTKITHMYASEHTISPELKDYIRSTIRDNRKKHTMHIDPDNLDTIVRCTHCWWNPINAKVLRPYLHAKGYAHILHDKEAQGARGTKSAEQELI